MKIGWKVSALCTLLLALCVTVFAAAPDATVTWTAPVAYADGSDLAVGTIDHYTITWSRAAGGAVLGSLDVKAPAVTASVPVACGTMYFSATVTTGASATYPAATSDPAGPVPFVSTVSCKPNPPGGLAAH